MNDNSLKTMFGCKNLASKSLVSLVLLGFVGSFFSCKSRDLTSDTKTAANADEVIWGSTPSRGPVRPPNSSFPNVQAGRPSSRPEQRVQLIQTKEGTKFVVYNSDKPESGIAYSSPAVYVDEVKSSLPLECKKAKLCFEIKGNKDARLTVGYLWVVDSPATGTPDAPFIGQAVNGGVSYLVLKDPSGFEKREAYLPIRSWRLTERGAF